MTQDMLLKDTINLMRHQLFELSKNLEKAARGNQAAAQRVRTGSVKFAKTAKVFRKESLHDEKGKMKKRGKKGARRRHKSPVRVSSSAWKSEFQSSV